MKAAGGLLHHQAHEPPTDAERGKTRNAHVEKANAREERKGPTGAGSRVSGSSCWGLVSSYEEKFRSKCDAGGLRGLLKSFLIRSAHAQKRSDRFAGN